MARITNGTFPGPAGQLEYILYEDAAPAGAPPPRLAAVVCHPHPLFGGTMHTRIVFQAAQALAELAIPTLRFNFRGVGGSQGAHDHGRGEQQDVRAAIAFLRQRYPLPLLLGGFSFGASAVVNTLAALPAPEVERVLLLGLPVEAAWRRHQQSGRPLPKREATPRSECERRSEARERPESGVEYPLERAELPTRWRWHGPKLMISGDHDEFARVQALEAYFQALPEPKAREWIPGGDHFLTGQRDQFRAVLARHLSQGVAPFAP